MGMQADEPKPVNLLYRVWVWVGGEEKVIKETKSSLYEDGKGSKRVM